MTEWNQNEPFDWRSLVAIVAGAVLLLPLTTRMPMLGWEWPFYLGGIFDETYPPWFQMALKPLSIWQGRLGLSLLHGLFMMSVAVGTVRAAAGHSRTSRLTAAAMALWSPLVLMLLWEGNMAMLSLVGLVNLPFGIPWALVQPHLASWALLARRNWTLWAIAFGVLSLAVWGLWPLQTLGLLNRSSGHLIAMGWINLGWPVLIIGLLMLPFTNADPLRLMAVGAFLLPYIMAVHLVLLLPALGRVTGWRRLLLWGMVWMTVLALSITLLWAKYAAMLFPLAVWWMLRPQTVTVNTYHPPSTPLMCLSNFTNRLKI